MNLIKKISAKTVCGTIKRPDEDADPKDLFAIIGVATGIETGETTFGQWTAFVGDFEATNMETGEVFRAPKAFLPEPACGMLKSALSNNENVEIGLMVGYQPSDTPIGYEYITKPLHESRAVDPLEHIRKAVAAKVPQLAGPMESGEKTDGGKKK